MTRDERRQDAFKHKYTAAQLVETLQGKLNSPDSPAYRSPRSSPKTLTTSPHNSRGRDTYRPKPVRSLVREEIPTIHEEDGDDIVDQQPMGLSDTVWHIEVPNEPRARRVFHTYAAVVGQIGRDGARVVASDKCLVCGGIHRFDGCPVLNDTKFLSSHYIRLCQFLRRNGQLADSVLKPATRSVHFVDAMDDESHEDSPPQQDDDSSDEEMDFLTGRS